MWSASAGLCWLTRFGLFQPALEANSMMLDGWLARVSSIAPASRRALVVFGHLWSRAHANPLSAPGTLVSLPHPTHTHLLGMPLTNTGVWAYIFCCKRTVCTCSCCCLDLPCLQSLKEASRCVTFSQACSASCFLCPFCQISGTGHAVLAALARWAGSTCLRQRTHPHP